MERNYRIVASELAASSSAPRMRKKRLGAEAVIALESALASSSGGRDGTANPSRSRKSVAGNPTFTVRAPALDLPGIELQNNCD
jgi:hypothetical protein